MRFTVEGQAILFFFFHSAEFPRISVSQNQVRGIFRDLLRFAQPFFYGLFGNISCLWRHQLIESRVTVETDLTDSLPAVLGDPVQLQQVLLNLIMNAMDAMASTPDGLRRIQICSRAMEAGTIEIYLKDNGPGIEAADRKRVFVPFYTTKKHGLGLGLSICSTIIEKHGGSIALRNDHSGGVMAEISLPAKTMPFAAQ